MFDEVDVLRDSMDLQRLLDHYVGASPPTVKPGRTA